MNRDSHWQRALIHDDDASQCIEGGGASRPAGEDLFQPVGSLGAVLSDRALDEFVDELGIARTNGIEEIFHPLKADGEAGLERAGEVIASEISFKIGNEA
jgi:hypothetical protein